MKGIFLPLLERALVTSSLDEVLIGGHRSFGSMRRRPNGKPDYLVGLNTVSFPHPSP